MVRRQLLDGLGRGGDPCFSRTRFGRYAYFHECSHVVVVEMRGDADPTMIREGDSVISILYKT
jgi:hypothetical protein